MHLGNTAHWVKALQQKHEDLSLDRLHPSAKMSILPHQPSRNKDRRVPGSHCPTSLAKLLSSSLSDVAVQRPWMNWVYLKGELEMKGGAAREG